MKCLNCGTVNSIVAQNCVNCGTWFNPNQDNTLVNTQGEGIVKANQSYAPYVLMGLAILYTLSPVDVIPDIPVLGWVDDIFLLAATGVNVLENGLGLTNGTLKSILKFIKWGIIILGAIATALFALVGVAIYKLISG